jgi:hypothetical protein
MYWDVVDILSGSVCYPHLIDGKGVTIETARTTTSVSLLLIFILRYPHEDASLA